MGNLKKITALLFIIIFLISLATILFVIFRMQPKTITVPDDYPTIQAAIANASAGDTVFVKRGTYNGEIIINKPLSLIGEDANGTIINGRYELYYPRPWGWNTVTIGASDVLISGFTITNCEHAVAINPYSGSLNTHNLSRIRIIGNNIENSHMGIFEPSGGLRIRDHNVYISANNFTNLLGGLSLTSSDSIISNNIFSANEAGLSIVGGDNVTISFNSIESTSQGITLALASNTFVFDNNITGSVADLSGYYGYGFSFATNCNNSLIFDNNIWGNTYGIALGIAESRGFGSSIYGNNLFDNTENANVSGTVILETIVSWDNGTMGNYWGDYLSKYPNAAEIDSSGIWNTPYIIEENNADNYPLIRQVNIPMVTATPKPNSVLIENWFQPLIIIIVIVAVVVVVLLLFRSHRKNKQTE
jgi:nitrous oxidase accessory protein NosD